MELSCKSASGAYTVRIQRGLIAEAPALLKELAGTGRVWAVADPAVWDLQGSSFKKAGIPWIEIPAGEKAKTWEEAGRFLERLAALGADRTALLAVLGGGLAGDLPASRPPSTSAESVGRIFRPRSWRRWTPAWAGRPPWT